MRHVEKLHFAARHVLCTPRRAVRTPSVRGTAPAARHRRDKCLIKALYARNQALRPRPLDPSRRRRRVAPARRSRLVRARARPVRRSGTRSRMRLVAAAGGRIWLAERSAPEH